MTLSDTIRWFEMRTRARRKVLKRALKPFRLLQLSLFPSRITLKHIFGALLAIIFFSVLILGLSGVLNVSKTLPGSGKITAIGVGIYQDSACTVPLTELDWGTLDPGSTEYIEVYLRNEGNVPVTLSLSAVNWSPSNASSFFEFGWDYDNSVINARQDNVLKAMLYLRVSSDAQDLTEFTFDVIVDATKA